MLVTSGGHPTSVIVVCELEIKEDKEPRCGSAGHTNLTFEAPVGSPVLAKINN